MNKLGKALMVLGIICMVGALGIVAFNIWDNNRAGRASNEVLSAMEGTETDPDAIQERIVYTESTGMDTVPVNDYEYIGTISIPDLSLELPVMSEWSYEGLKIAPGRVSGSVRTNDLVICAHNYDRHFGRIKTLDAGDVVAFTDIDGHTTEYQVALTETLQPTDVEEMTSGEYDLTLFTCTPGGKARVTVRCEKIG